MPLLFSYGTLRDPGVQKATFGRELTGRQDRVLGFRLSLVEITDPRVVEVSGLRNHPILISTGDLADGVDGLVLEVTEDDLAQSDAFAVPDYERVETHLASGDAAWAYVSRSR
ncbi:gamma-glutamylcyclotransferase family protein [Actinoplanes sp. DH11]|uniref:gamma-glutamylcyclotransferase family protein n=1 Tax=Actinoplanes sp. DH11 TaxID=2857011 RepID=UPI001E618C7D|nr:gamma-glutamylcyclotransferase family protein [Actinoplanes sp. DH11]